VSEISHHAPGVPNILVGTKLDLRGNVKTEQEAQSKGASTVTFQEGEAMSKLINAYAYLECSAKTQLNVGDVFDEAVR